MTLVNKNRKIISLVLIFILIFTMISMPSTNAYAASESIKLGDSENPPEITIDYVGTSPKYPVVGEEVEVTYKVTANKFSYDIPSTEKEIVLVIDRSGSMEYCSNHTTSDRHTHEGGICNIVPIDFNTGTCSVHPEEKLPHNNYGSKCTNIKNNYCKTHNTNREHWYECKGGKKENPCIHGKTNKHYVKCTEETVDNYCVTHDTTEEHRNIVSVCNASRMDATKYAAINFVNRLSDISNLKVSLITYSSSAKTEKFVDISKRIVDEVDVNEESRNNLINKIISINASGGTNQGEGLRQAANILGDINSSSKNRSIILMTDGQPTFYSIGNNNGYYTDIDNTKPSNNTGNDYTRGYEYAKKIASLISKRGYNNIFSIGYALGEAGQGGNEKLYTVHNNMGGTANTFYATQGAAIDDIFNQIAENLELDYKFDAQLQFGINSSFESVQNITIQDGNQFVTIPQISYKLKEGTTNVYLPNGKDKEEVYLKFKVKATKSGSLNLFDNAKIKYTDVRGNIKEVAIGSPTIQVSNTPPIPVIEAELISDEVINATSDDEIEVKYTLTPESFEYISNSNTEDKEVVFLIDTSKEMEALNKVKTALINRVINHFLNRGSKIKVNFITYDSTITQHLTDSEAKDQNGATIDYRNELQTKINNISNSSSSERKLGIAISAADSYFKENNNVDSIKNIIIIAGGEPTDEMPIISTEQYNIITLAVSNQDSYQNPYSNLKSWHNSLGGNDNNYFISSKSEGHNDIDSRPSTAGNNPLAPNGDIMSVIADRIEGMNYRTYTINDVKLNFDLALNFDVVSGLEQNGAYYSVTIPKIRYVATEKITDTRYNYEAKPMEISFRIKPREGKFGALEFGKNTSTDFKNYVSYIKLDASQATNSIDKTPIVIVEEQLLNNRITIQVRDSNGNIDDKYDTNDSTSEDGQYLKANIKNEFNKDYKLYGDSYADLVFTSNNMNYLKYKVSTIADFPSDNIWDDEIVVDSTGENGGINGDIGQQGYLTQKSYDVSHLPQYGVESTDINWLTSKWSDRNELYKNPYYDGVSEKSAGTAKSGDKDGYVKEVNYINPITNETEVRWVPQTVFTEYARIDGTYKEASKTWGYFKVSESGKYSFKTRSDDGIKATLTVNDEEFVIVDDFTVHGPKWSNPVTVDLEAGMYYPIFIEYYNCGAEAAYLLQYSGPETANQFINVPSTAFYSSKSKNPGESSNGGFTGETGIKLPEEAGTYYIVYEAGIKNENNEYSTVNNGIYGPFIIDTRFELTRNIEYIGNGEYYLDYNIKPNNIDFTDIYRTNQRVNEVVSSNGYIQELDVINLQLSDIIPDDIEIIGQVDVSGSPVYNIPSTIINNQLAGTIGDNDYKISYNLNNSQNNVPIDWEYTAQEIKIRLKLKTENQNSGTIEFADKTAKLLYDDILLELNGQRKRKEGFFNAVNTEIQQTSMIIGQDLFDGVNADIQIKSNISISENMNYMLATKFDIKSDSSIFTIELPSGASLTDNNVYVYEVKDSRIDKQSQKTVSIDISDGKTVITNRLSNVILEKGKQYMVVYNITLDNIQSNTYINSSIDRDKDKKLYFNKMTLPDLF